MKNELGGKNTKEFFGLRAKSLKLDFSKFYFKTCTLCLLFISSHEFIALEFDSSLLVPFFEKIVKQHDRNEIKSPIGKMLRI